MRDRSVVRLSITPSTKYSCSGSPPMFANGSTTIESLGAAALRRSVGNDRIGPDRAGDVLEVAQTEVGEVNSDLAMDLIEHRRRQTDATGLGDALEPRGNVDAIAEDVVGVNDDVADM